MLIYIIYTKSYKIYLKLNKMSTCEYYCKICHHRWKLKKDYDKHLVCCEFFHNLRKQKYEMDEFGVKIPNQQELFLYVRELALK